MPINKINQPDISPEGEKPTSDGQRIVPEDQSAGFPIEPGLTVSRETVNEHREHSNRSGGHTLEDESLDK